ncbi:uncharacterized protein LOC142625254 [Castanea sativa]|uniref:uncharacterized protein LOC142625254 n=1 Tax=Castanea sativa TaxID=21020 RepID=UPI003F64DAA7
MDRRIGEGDRQIGLQTRAPEWQNTSDWRLDRSSLPQRAAQVPMAPPLSLRPPCSLNLKIFHFCLSLSQFHSQFEEIWLFDSRCGEVVEVAWRSCVSLDPNKEILGKIEKCGKDLSWWNYNVFGNVRRELKKKRDMLVEEEAASLRIGSNVQIKELLREINELLDRETRMWNQRSCILWLKNGDGNTKFFHSRASHRYRKNVIMEINDLHGVWTEGPNDIADVLIQYYSELFTTSSLTIHQEALHHIPQVITEDMDKELTSRFEEWELNQALKQMAPMKAPGPNGMPPLFFQHFWPMIEGNVTHSVLSWLNSGATGFMALKLDMSKAYDRVEWVFLENVMRKMGFSEKWIGFIMMIAFFFVGPISNNAARFLDLLSLYEEVSGQKINREKTSLFFSKVVIEANRQIIKGILGVCEIHHYEKYLGLPSLTGRGKKASFNYLKEKVWRKLQGWKGKLLSQAGREVLIKVVIQAISTYAMGCFKLPLGLCNEIEVMVRKFWWGQRGEKRKIHWLKWGEMTKAKTEGGMRFRDLALHNDSLLAKQAWRLMEDKNSLF